MLTDDFRVFISRWESFQWCISFYVSSASPQLTVKLEQILLNLATVITDLTLFCTFALLLHPLSAHKHTNLKPPPWVSYTCSCTFSIYTHAHTHSLQYWFVCSVLAPPPSPPPPFPHFLPPILPLSVRVSSSASLPTLCNIERPTAYWWRGVWALGRQTWEKTRAEQHSW